MVFTIIAIVWLILALRTPRTGSRVIARGVSSGTARGARRRVECGAVLTGLAWLAAAGVAGVQEGTGEARKGWHGRWGVGGTGVGGVGVGGEGVGLSVAARQHVAVTAVVAGHPLSECVAVHVAMQHASPSLVSVARRGRKIEMSTSITNILGMQNEVAHK